jgi:hypothetical protein
MNGAAEWAQLVEAFGGTPEPVPPSPPEAAAPPLQWEDFTPLHGLEDELDRFEASLQLSSLPSEDPHQAGPSAQQQPSNDLRILAVRKRLRLLGYEADPEGAVLDEALRQKVREFQADSGITVDGWVGRETWDALQELITLEPPLDLDLWFPKGETACPSLSRAVGLRLKMLGFEAQPVPSLQALGPGLDAFQAVLRALGLLTPKQARLEARQLVRLVFDDKLLLDLAERRHASITAPGWCLRLDAPEDSCAEGSPQDADSRRASRFIRRLVRNELWLLGYEVGRLDLPTDHPETSKAFQAGLEAFLRDHADGEALPSAEAPGARALRIDFDLMKQIQRVHGQEVANPAHVARFVRENRGQLAQIWSLALPKNPVYFLWDGVKRCAAWLGRWFKRGAAKLGEVLEKGLEHAKTFLWNVLRFVYQSSSDALTTVRKAIALVAEGLRTFHDGGELREGRQGAQVLCRMRLDGDNRLLVEPGAGQASIQRLKVRLTRTRIGLEVGLIVLREVAVLVVGAARGTLGWFSLVGHFVEQAHEWQRYEAALAGVPELPPAEDEGAVQLGSMGQERMEPKPGSGEQPPAPSLRLWMMVAAGVLLLAAVLAVTIRC